MQASSPATNSVPFTATNTAEITVSAPAPSYDMQMTLSYGGKQYVIPFKQLNHLTGSAANGIYGCRGQPSGNYWVNINGSAYQSFTTTNGAVIHPLSDTSLDITYCLKYVGQYYYFEYSEGTPVTSFGAANMQAYLYQSISSVANSPLPLSTSLHYVSNNPNGV